MFGEEDELSGKLTIALARIEELELEQTRLENTNADLQAQIREADGDLGDALIKAGETIDAITATFRTLRA